MYVCSQEGWGPLEQGGSDSPANQLVLRESSRSSLHAETGAKTGEAVIGWPPPELPSPD